MNKKLSIPLAALAALTACHAAPPPLPPGTVVGVPEFILHVGHNGCAPADFLELTSSPLTDGRRNVDTAMLVRGWAEKTASDHFIRLTDGDADSIWQLIVAAPIRRTLPVLEVATVPGGGAGVCEIKESLRSYKVVRE